MSNLDPLKQRTGHALLPLFIVGFVVVCGLSARAQKDQIIASSDRSQQITGELYQLAQAGDLAETQSTSFRHGTCLADMLQIESEFGKVLSFEVMDSEVREPIGLPIKITVEVSRTKAGTTEIVTMETRYHLSNIRVVGEHYRQ